MGIADIFEALTAKGVYDVGLDQYEWAKTSAEWVRVKAFVASWHSAP